MISIEAFHFIRPYWLLLLFPLAGIVLLLLKQTYSSMNWQSAIDESLLSHLSDEQQSKQQQRPWWILAVTWFCIVIALAGPTWKKLPQPVIQNTDALVVILDLSLSMLAQDVKPSRIVRARAKLNDLLDARGEGVIGLIAYAGDSHIVSPLTDDFDTIKNLIPALNPDIMPLAGSNTVDAFDRAKQLFENAGIAKGNIILFTDEVGDRQISKVTSLMQGTNFRVSILGLGTSTGAPIPNNNGFLKDNTGQIIIPKLDRQPLEEMANTLNGRYIDVRLDNADVDFLLAQQNIDFELDNPLKDRNFDQWDDKGPLLILLILPLAAFAFRRGWLLTLPLLMILPHQNSHAFTWQDLWKHSSQQGVDYYNAEQYDKAIEAFSRGDSTSSHYNRGNALARAQQFEEAIKAYDSALEIDPNNEDAQFNKQLIEDLLNQQQQQQQQQQQNDNSSDSEQNNENQQQSNESGDNQQDQQQAENSQQQDQEQQSQQEQSQEQQSQDQPQEQQSQEPTKNNEQESQLAKPEDKESSSDEQSEAQQQLAEQREKSEQQQATEQWLRQIPDDPSGLLRRKFRYESSRRETINEAEKQW